MTDVKETMIELGQITVYNREVDSIVQNLDRYGICIVKNYLSADELSGLVEEHENIYQSGDSGIFSVSGHPTNEDGMVARSNPRILDVRNFRLTKSVFLSDFFLNISQKYFGTGKILLNNEVFFTHEKSSEQEILPWHFDRQHSLKFYINLLDVDSENGAFEFDVGSHREGHFRANYYIMSGTKIGKIPNDIPAEEIRNPLTILARSGDLIVFDSDGFHKGGRVNEGRERKVIRGHTHSLPIRGYSPKMFDAGWWLAGPFNIARYLHKRGARNLPAGRLTRSRLTR